MNTKMPAQTTAVLLHLCLFYWLSVSYLDVNVIKRVLSEQFVWWAQRRWCAAVSGLKRSGVTALSALCAAVRAHLLLPPLSPPQRTGIRGCLSFRQNTLPLEAVPLSPGVVVGFYGDSRTLFPPQNRLLFSALWIPAAITSGKAPADSKHGRIRRLLAFNCCPAASSRVWMIKVLRFVLEIRILRVWVLCVHASFSSKKFA